MAELSLQASPRDRVGKGSARAARREGLVPAVIYGGKESPLPITLPYKEVNIAIKSGGFLTHVINVELDGKKHRVIPKDYQLDPVRDFPMHVDFLRVSKDTTVTVEVRANFLNEETCVGLKRGGVLNVVRYAIEVVCPADAIPEQIDCDIASLDIGDSLHISSITLPEGVTPTITDRDFTIATIASPGGGVQDDAEEGEEESEAEE